MSRFLCLCFSFALLVVVIEAFAPRYASSVHSTIRVRSSVVDDKVEVKDYFNNEGFNRWNKIYSESGEVNKVQLDIRNGHQQTLNKVLKWLSIEDNKEKTVCDAGCGVGSLALPMSDGFQKVFASDISSSMTMEAGSRAVSNNVENIEFKVSDMEALDGSYNTVTCIDVMIHYPDDKIEGIIGHLGSLATDRLIISFAPKNFFYSTLKKIGELFPGPSKTTRAYLHTEESIIKALKKAGFKIERQEMTSTNFYFSRLLEAKRV